MLRKYRRHARSAGSRSMVGSRDQLRSLLVNRRRRWFRCRENHEMARASDAGRGCFGNHRICSGRSILNIGDQMTLPYKRKRSSPSTKRPAVRAQGERRAPDIYVRIEKPFGNMISGSFAKAHIRVRRGCYRFLSWRDGDRVREFYLGRLGHSAPTRRPPSSGPTRSPAEALSSSRRRGQK